MLVFKIDVIEELKKVGITATNAKKSKVLSQSTFTKLKNGDTNLSLETLNILCCLLEMQPRDIIKFVETEQDEKILKNLKNSIDNH